MNDNHKPIDPGRAALLNQQYAIVELTCGKRFGGQIQSAALGPLPMVAVKLVGAKSISGAEVLVSLTALKYIQLTQSRDLAAAVNE